MEFNWSILGWIAGLLFVYAFGLFEGRGQGYKRRKAEEEQEKKKQPAPAPAAAETVTIDDPGLLRIKDENGSFVLDLDGQRVNPSSLSPGQRRRLIDMLNIMRPWLEGRSASVPAPASTPRPTVPPPPSSEPTTLEERLKAIGSPSTSSKPASAQPAPAASPPPSPSPMARSSTIAKDDRPVAPANSIVGQIDAVLQERLAGTPLEERGIFLAQSPEGSVNVFVGLTRYNGIDEVPDPEIKAAIRAAISEWENKYTPGF
jgi:hypothetical protein